MRLSGLMVAVFLSGCDYFAPAYVTEADERAVEGYQELSEVLAKAELGLLERKTTFSDEADNYASALSKFETAKLALTVSKRAAAGTASRASVTLSKIVDGCIQSIKLFAEEHQLAGIVPNAGATQGARAACDLAVKAIQARKQ